uniref:CW domain-containing protein n=1 Tax=Caenorhabditis japonica TaxID=281687 RepID=A0A8R1HJD9_CAEJA
MYQPELFLFFITTLFLIVFGQSTTSMIVIWGEPSNYSNFQLYNATSWDDCVMYCYEDDTCVGAYSEQFDYSDQYMTNYGGIFWDPNQPDGNSTGSWQNCLMIWLRQEWQYNSTYWETNPNGAADDAICNVGYFTSYSIRGVVCGKLPDVDV